MFSNLFRSGLAEDRGTRNLKCLLKLFCVVVVYLLHISYLLAQLNQRACHRDESCLRLTDASLLHQDLGFFRMD